MTNPTKEELIKAAELISKSMTTKNIPDFLFMSYYNAFDIGITKEMIVASNCGWDYIDEQIWQRWLKDNKKIKREYT